MNAIILILILDTILELVVTKFSFWWLTSLVIRALFCLRIVGATFKVFKLCIAEACSFAMCFLYYTLFYKGHVPWDRIALVLLFTGIACLLMFIDHMFYVYVTEDDEE